MAARLALVAVCLAVFPLAAMGQTTSSSLEGRVRTPSGEPVADTVVQARSDATGVVRSAVTDARGRYRFTLLAPGLWTVLARLPDGQTTPARKVTLRLQETMKLDFTATAVITEKVTVQAETPMVDPRRSGGEFRVDGRQVDTLPLSGRAVTDLALLDSSITATPPGNFYGERGTAFVVNGQSGRSNSFLVDGLDNNDQSSGTTLNAHFSQQVIREFVVQTRQYNAEFGRASGGILNIITRRGGNDATGGAFVQGAAGQWNRPGRFVESLPRPDGLQDATGRFQTGFNFGGPLRKDRAFYFVAYEHQESDEVVPFTGVGRDGRAGGWMIAPNRDDNLFLRTDFNLGGSHQLMLRLSGDDRETNGLTVGGITTPETGFRVDEKDLQFAASLTSVITPNLLNEVRVLAGSSTFDQFANSSRPGVERPSGKFGGNNLNRQFRNEHRYQIVDNLTWSTGQHTMKFGIDLTKSRTTVRAKFNPTGNFLYETDDPFNVGDCGDILASQVEAFCSEDGTTPCRRDTDCKGVCVYEPVECSGDGDGDGTPDEPGFVETYPLVYQLILGKPQATLKDSRVALFAQDSWEIGPRFTLDYGLRYDLSTFTLPSGTRVDSKIPNGGAGRDKDNLSPRLGFVYRPVRDGKLVFRGGAGVFYDKLVLGFPAVASITSGIDIGLTFPQGLTFEITEDNIEDILKVIRKNQDLFFPEELILKSSTGTRLETPYMVQYSLEAERAVGEHHAWRANVVRALGYHLPLLRDLNPVVATTPQGVPIHRDDEVGSIAATVTEGRSWYSALDLGWRGRSDRGWYALSYTWSKARDMGPDPLKGGLALPPDSDDLEGEKARSDADRRHRLVVSAESGLPFMNIRASGVVHLATGSPFNVTTGRDENLDGITTDRPMGLGRNSGKDTPLDKVNRLRKREGLPPVRSLSEPSFAQVDLRVWKPFPLGSRDGHGEIYAQIFNLFDRFNGGPVEGRVIARNFGEPIGQVGPPRTFEFGLKVGF